MLKIPGNGYTALKLGDSSKARVGDFVVAIGDPTGLSLAGTPTFGIISAMERSVNIEGKSNTYIQTDAAINPGNSGGPHKHEGRGYRRNERQNGHRQLR